MEEENLKMGDHYSYSDCELEEQFRNCEFPAPLFSHEAHLRLAWIHLTKYGQERAVRNITRELRSYVVFLGAEDKYNETLTVAAVKAVWHFMLRSEARNFKDFIAENPRLKYNFKDLIFQHYSTDIFNSPAAKKKFQEPELLPFD